MKNQEMCCCSGSFLGEMMVLVVFINIEIFNIVK